MRTVFAIAGVAALAWGVYLVAEFAFAPDSWQAAMWFLGGPVVHDAVVAPGRRRHRPADRHQAARPLARPGHRRRGGDGSAGRVGGSPGVAPARRPGEPRVARP